MGNRRISCRARDRLRQREAQPRAFVPAIGIEQIVLFSDEQALEYRSNVHNRLGRGLGSKFRNRYRVVKPEQMRLPIIRPEDMASQVQKSNGKLKVEQARQIAVLLKSRLEEMLEDVEEVPLQVGQLTTYSEEHPRKPFQRVPMIGAYPLGWKGAKVRIASNDAEGRAAASAVVQQAGVLCSKIIADEYEGIEPRSLVADPRIPVIRLKQSGRVPPAELSIIGDAVTGSLPEGARLSYPILTLRTGAGRHDVEIMPVTGPSESGGFPLSHAA